MNTDSDKKNELEEKLNELEFQKSLLVSKAYFLLPHQVPVFAIPILLSVFVARFLFNNDVADLPQLLGICVFIATSLSWIVIFLRVRATRHQLKLVSEKVRELQNKIEKSQ